MRHNRLISIHALLAESDAEKDADWVRVYVFLSTLSLRRATHPRMSDHPHNTKFLSTLSLRRATRQVDSHSSTRRISIHALLAESDPGEPRPPAPPRHFYPRSPCGERPACPTQRKIFVWISIHALLAESDTVNQFCTKAENISIHALLAESDLANGGAL